MLPVLLLALFAIALPATAAETDLPAAEVVVVVGAGETALVGVGEPPTDQALTALVYLAGEDGADRWNRGAIPRAVRSLAATMGGAPLVRVLAGADGEPFDTSDLERGLKKAGFPPVTVHDDTGALTRQMTADAGGFHTRGEPGRPAPTAAEAVARWRQVASYGHGHTEPMFEPDGAGGQTQLRVPGWDEEVAAYACPFPTLLATPAPAGYAVEMGVAGGRTVSEEALASWCERAARELLRECGSDELTAAFADGDHAETAFGDPPGPGLWWLAPARVLPPGGVGGEPCVSPALDRLRVAADHAGLILHVGLTEDDVEAGCRRQRLESCRE
ncbi:MAG: hypothetical protein QGH45_03830 [Myxococcota bacterium]|jgi:hypothetical protein|nr:hypothetical protein [Myxococcota bacterium]